MKDEPTVKEEQPALHINLAQGTSELVLRSGAALELREPDQVVIAGCITAPADWLEKRASTLSTEKRLQSHVIVDEDNGRITLRIDETNPYGTAICGVVLPSEESKVLPINTGKAMSALALSDMIKAHRYLFDSTEAAMKLVTALRGMKAKIDGDVEKARDDRGNYAIVRRQSIESNIPQGFYLRIPILKGLLAIVVTVEISIDTDTLEVRLISPNLTELTRDATKACLSTELQRIIECAPEIVIVRV